MGQACCGDLLSPLSKMVHREWNAESQSIIQKASKYDYSYETLLKQLFNNTFFTPEVSISAYEMWSGIISCFKMTGDTWMNRRDHFVSF